MRFEVLSALLDRLKNDPALAAYVSTNYPTPINYFVGVKLKPTANEFPYIAVAPAQETRENWRDNRSQIVSVLFGVNEAAVNDGEFLGIRRASEIGELILKALAPQPITTSPYHTAWQGDARIFSDAGIQHPFYEAEISITLMVRLT